MSCCVVGVSGSDQKFTMARQKAAVTMSRAAFMWSSM